MLKNYKFPSIVDERRKGVLRVFEFANVPFSTKRIFSVLTQEVGCVRGQHAHKLCNQLICCLAGSIKLICDDGKKKCETTMTPLSEGIMVPAGIWAEQICLDKNSVIMVFCDQPYDENDYIRNYSDFLKFKKGNLV